MGDTPKKINITSSLQNYLFRLVHNEFITIYNKKRSRVILEQKYFESLDRITENYNEKILTKVLNKIKNEIQSLPPKCKEVFLLSRRDGLTHIEISEFLNISTKTVEAHITKVFTILRKKLKDKLHTMLFLLFGMENKLKYK